MQRRQHCAACVYAQRLGERELGVGVGGRARGAAERLTSASRCWQSSYMWKIEEGDYRDDITVVVLTFPWLESYGDDE